MADTPAQAAAKFGQLAARLSGRDRRLITERVAAKTKPVAAAAIDPDTLSHWGRGSKKGGHHVKARYVIKSDTTVHLYPTIPPLAALLEKGSGTTWKAPRRRGSARRRRGSVGTYTRARVPARRAWSKAAAAVEPVAPKIVDQEIQRILRDVF